MQALGWQFLIFRSNFLFIIIGRGGVKLMHLGEFTIKATPEICPDQKKFD
jgi:hypothetical protein